jgi:pantoate--beta-alanine ligase
MATNVVVAPTIRESDGLALSSRNVYLSVKERSAAPSIYRALTAVVRAIEAGETEPARALAAGREILEEPLAWDYLAIVDPVSFAPCDPIVRPCIVIAVARAGSVRLLDNIPVTSPSGIDPVLTPPHALPRGVRARPS